MTIRNNFEYENADGDDRLEVTMKDSDSIYFTVESDWAGDTETGFGASCSVNLLKKDAIQLANEILIWSKT